MASVNRNFRNPSGESADLAELARLFRTERASLVHRLVRITGTTDEAEDVAQVAFVRLLEVMPGMHELRSSRAYLYRIAHNLAIDYVRRRALAKRIFDPVDLTEHHEGMAFSAPASDASSNYDTNETMRKVYRELGELPLKCQQAFMLSKMEENTYPEIATQMNLSVSMIEKYLSRALLHIRTAVPYESAC